MPSGIVVPYAGPTAPSGWLLCDGTAVSRTTYASLFTAIGTAWGYGDQTTTFNLPDLRGRFLRGVDGGAGNDPDTAGRGTIKIGGNSGDNVGSAQGHAFQTHTHNVSDSGHSHNVEKLVGSGSSVNAFASTAITTASGTTTISGPVDSNTTGITVGAPLTGSITSETRPINAYVNYIIKT